MPEKDPEKGVMVSEHGPRDTDTNALAALPQKGKKKQRA
jgi:hypothetical protein